MHEFKIYIGGWFEESITQYIRDENSKQSFTMMIRGSELPFQSDGDTAIYGSVVDSRGSIFTEFTKATTLPDEIEIKTLSDSAVESYKTFLWNKKWSSKSELKPKNKRFRDT